MTTTEKIAKLRIDIAAYNDMTYGARVALRAAQAELFRERHGFGVGDWILFYGKPAVVARTYIYGTPEFDSLWVHLLTKRGSLARREEGYGVRGAKLSDYAAPWPADRPVPEVKP